MRQTLFHIPHEIGPLPVFGWGWALIAWLMVSCLIVWLGRREGWMRAVANVAPMTVIVGLVLVLVLPRLEETVSTQSGDVTLGLPIRGYGVMLFCAMVAGVALAMGRARERGIPSELIYALATWLFLFGIGGARLFYLIQYRDEFQDGSLFSLLNIAQGGLVVYGSFIGGAIGFFLFCRRYQVPSLVIGDLIAPSLMLGLAIGRIGCLLNGCCYGGRCEDPWGVRFPRESVAYAAQARDGTFHGLRLDYDDEHRVIVGSVAEDSPAREAGLAGGECVLKINGWPLDDAGTAKHLRVPPDTVSDPLLIAGMLLERSGRTVKITTGQGDTISWRLEVLPRYTTPLHATQIYSSISALLLCGLLLAYDRVASRDGAVFALCFTIYPIVRFVLEVIRADEGSLGSTGMTISQNISVGVLVLAVALWASIWRSAPGKSHLVPG